MTLPNSRVQPDVYLATKRILQPHLTLGHSLHLCLITKHDLRTYFTIKPSLWPCLDTEFSQWHHLVRKHSLRPHQTRINCRAQLKTLTTVEFNKCHHPVREHSLWPCLTRGDCRAQLVTPSDRGAQPGAQTHQGDHSTTPPECRAQTNMEPS